jgi:hypothetical protein
MGARRSGDLNAPAATVAIMPATFPSHAAAVLPLKLLRPGLFDGVALVIGAAAPDLPWDHVTHAAVPGTRVGLPRLSREIVPGVPWWMPLHLASSAAGAAGWLALSAHLGRRRLIRTWHGPAPAVPAHPRRFWATTAAVGAAGAFAAVTVPATRERIVPFLPPLPRPAVLSARLLAVAAAALAAGAAGVRPATGPGTGIRVRVSAAPLRGRRRCRVRMPPLRLRLR